MPWAGLFLLVAVALGVLGFGSPAATAEIGARVLFFVFLVLSVVTLIGALVSRRLGRVELDSLDRARKDKEHRTTERDRG